MKNDELRVFSNGFVARHHNRRIECVENDKGNYEMRFTILIKEPEDTTDEDLNAAYNLAWYRRCGCIIGVNELFFTPKALDILTRGWILFSGEKQKNEFKRNTKGSTQRVPDSDTDIRE